MKARKRKPASHTVKVDDETFATLEQRSAIEDRSKVIIIARAVKLYERQAADDALVGRGK